MRRYGALIGIILVGLVAALAILSTRWAVEGRTRTVEVILDAQAWRELAIREGRPPAEVFAAVHARGATSVAIYEGTLRRLQEAGRASYFSGGDLQDAARAGTLAPPLRALVTSGRVRVEAVYVLAHPSVAEWVEEGFRGLLGTGRVRRLGQVLEVLGTRPDLEELGLGFLPEELASYQAEGFHLVLRPRNYRGLSTENIGRKLDLSGAAGTGHTVVFEGAEVLGYEGMIDEVARHLKELGYRYGRIEAFSAKRKQRGEDALTARMEPAVIRLFSLTPEEMAVLAPSAIKDKFIRAVQERSIRLLYLRPMVATSAGVDAMQANLDFVEAVVQGLNRHGFRAGRPDPLPPILPSPILLALVAAGTLALGAIALGELAGAVGVRLAARHLLALVAAGLLLTGLAWAGGRTFLLWRQALALGGAIAGATLAVVLTLAGQESSGGVLRRSLGALWRASALSAAAGVLIAALLTAWPFMLAIHTFLGVKVAHILPPVLAAFLLTFGARQAGGERFTFREVWRWLERPLRLQYAVIAVIAAVAAVMLLGRSGNFGIPLLAVESRMRELLEDLLVVRPRTKEFLIGHPALILAAAAQALGLRGWVVPLAVIGAVGQAGVINSFSHIHTPLVVILLRTFYALVIGSILGTVPVLILKRVIRRWRPVPAG